MTTKKTAKRISISVPHDEWSRFQEQNKEMIEEIATALNVEDRKIASQIYRALVRNSVVLQTPQDFSDFTNKANLQKGRLHVGFWIQK